MVDSISTFGLNTRILGTITGGQRDIADLQKQISSGYKADRYKDLDGEAQRLLQLRNQATRFTTYRDNIRAVNPRLDQMEAGASALLETSSKLRSFLLNVTNGGTYNSIDVKIQAQQYLNDALAQMNKQHDGKYVFAGSESNTAPVDVTNYTAAPYNAAPYTPPDFTDPVNSLTAPNTVYYEGDTLKAQVRISDNEVVDYGLTADDPAFGQLLLALRAIINDPPTGVTLEQQLDNALNASIKAVEGFSNMLYKIGVTGETLDDKEAELSDVIDKAAMSIADISATDIAAAMTQLTSVQTQLEATFMTVSRINNLSLLNYL